MYSDYINKCEARLADLLKLRNNWDGDTGDEVSHLAIQTARSLLYKLPELTPLYFIYPSYIGGVLLEFFTIDSYDISIEIDPTGSIQIYGFINYPGKYIYTTHYKEINQELIQFLKKITNT